MPHTEGPWRTEAIDVLEEEFDILGPRHVDADNCQYIATTYSGSEADARLIAKAPEMYALLKEIEFKGGSGDCDDAYLEICPICGERDIGPNPHQDDCKLAAVLKAVEGDQCSHDSKA